MEVDAGGKESPHRNARAKYGHECRRGYRQPARGERAIRAHAGDKAASIDHEHAEANQNRGQAETERDDEEEAQADAVQRERAQQHHQRRRAWDDAASDAQGEELIERNGFCGLDWLWRLDALFAGRKPVAMKLTRGVGVVEIKTAPAAKKHVSAEPGDGQAGEYAQPWVELLGHDVARCIKGDGAKSEYSRGMRGGDDETKQQGMRARCPASRPGRPLRSSCRGQVPVRAAHPARRQ